VNLEMMRARLAEIETEFRTMNEAAETRDFNEDESKKWTALETEHADLKRQIDEAVEAEARAQRVAESRAKWGSVQVAPAKVDPFEGDIRGLSDDQMIDRAATAISDVQYRRFDISDEARQAAVRKIETIDGAAAHALVHGSPAYMSAFRSWMRYGGAPIYSAEEAEAVRASMSLTSANGGYMLPTLLDPTLIETGTMTKNPIRRIARVVSGTQDKWNGVTVGNVTTAWKSEGSAFTDGTPTFGTVQVDAAMLTAYVTASYEIFQDSNAQAQLPGLIGEAIDMAEGVAFVSGSGSDAPYGIITQLSATAGSLVTVTTRGTFDSTSGVDTIKLFNALASRYEDSASFVANKATVSSIQQQSVGTTGTMLTEMVAAGTLLGSPIVRASSVTATTTSGNILAVLGDFGQYIVYDRIGVALEFIANVVDGSGIPTGQRGLVAYKRVGAKAADADAFRLLKA